MDVDIERLAFAERLTLLEITNAVVTGKEPIDSGELRRHVGDRLSTVDATVVGDLKERDIMRALNKLGTEEYVAENQPSTSPTGKGRPRYSLNADAEHILDALSEDERLEPLVEDIGE